MKCFPFPQDARRRHSSSPLGSTGSSNESLRTPEDLINRSEEDEVDGTAAAFENGEFSTKNSNRIKPAKKENAFRLVVLSSLPMAARKCSLSLSGAAGCVKGLVECFLEVLLSCLGSMAAAVQPNCLWNSQKTCYKTFSPICRPRL